MEIVTLLVGLSWPTLAAFFVVWFHAEIRGLINRMRSAGKEGVKFDPAPQTIPSGAPTSPTPVSMINNQNVAQPGLQAHSPRDLVNTAYRPLFDERVAKIKAALPAVINQFGWTADQILIALSAENNLTMHLERATRHIFASQIEALETLKLSVLPLARGNFLPYYTKGLATNPEFYGNYRFDQWFGFLLSLELVSEVPDGSVSITEAGRVAGRYMSDQGYVPLKA